MQGSQDGEAIFVGVSLADQQPEAAIIQPFHNGWFHHANTSGQMNHLNVRMQARLEKAEIISTCLADAEDQIGGLKPATFITMGGSQLGQKEVLWMALWCEVK